MKYLTIIVLGLIIALMIFIAFTRKSKQSEEITLYGEAGYSPQLSENGVVKEIIGSGGGGIAWREEIRVDNPDGTYTYKYKDHYDIVVASGSGGPVH